jgi:hypothetical protein
MNSCKYLHEDQTTYISLVVFKVDLIRSTCVSCKLHPLIEILNGLIL